MASSPNISDQSICIIEEIVVASALRRDIILYWRACNKRWFIVFRNLSVRSVSILLIYYKDSQSVGKPKATRAWVRFKRYHLPLGALVRAHFTMLVSMKRETPAQPRRWIDWISPVVIAVLKPANATSPLVDVSHWIRAPDFTIQNRNFLWSSVPDICPSRSLSGISAWSSTSEQSRDQLETSIARRGFSCEVSTENLSNSLSKCSSTVK